MIIHDDPAGLGLLSLVGCRATFLACRRPQRVQRRPRATARSPLHRRAVDTATGISIQRPEMPRSAHLPRAHLDPDPGALCDISIVAPVATHPKYGSPGAARAVIAGRADPIMARCRLADPCNFIQTSSFDAPSPVSPSPAGMTYAAVEPGRLKEGALRGQQGQTAPVVDTSLQRCVVQARFLVVLVPVTRNRSHLGFLPRRAGPLDISRYLDTC
ncbi:hypothetical protein M432DRAFT_365163 [Thermoascus aurantiacus ATCC 26904]